MYEKKLHYFTDAIAREVDARKQRAKHQMANNLSGETAAALEAAESRANFQFEATRRKLQRTANKKTAAATTQARADFTTKRNKLMNSLRQEAEEELLTFAEESPEYESYLIEKITKELNRSHFTTDSTLKIHPRDMKFAESIQKSTGLTPTKGTTDSIGGFILESPTSRADYTFKTLLTQ